jgi:hypothetical protein
MKTKNIKNRNVDITAESRCRDRILGKFGQLNISPTIVEIKEVNMDDIISNNNKVRFSGEDTLVIDKLVEIIKKNDYRPYDFVPPVVEPNEDGTYTIVSGHHRHHAHNCTKRNTMLCAVVDFGENDFERCVWRTAENSSSFEAYAKNLTTMSDHVSDVSERIQEGVIGNNRIDIEKYLIQTGIVSKKATKALNDYTNAILNAVGNRIDYVKTWTDVEKKDIVSELEQKISNRKFISATFKELNDGDFDHRFWVQATNAFFEDPTRPITGVYSMNGTSAEKIAKIRDHKPIHLVSRFFDVCKKVMDLYNEGHDIRNMVTLEYLPQLGSEINNHTDDGKNVFIESVVDKYGNTDDEDDVVQILEYYEKCDVKTKNRLKQLFSKENK